MKTKTFLTLTLLIIISATRVFSQTLKIQGQIKNGNGKKLQATYILRCNGQTISTGDANKISMQLDLNKNYTLVITKQGYFPKFYYFDTNTNAGQDYFFGFVTLLTKQEHCLQTRPVDDIKSTIVHFNQDNKAFCFVQSKLRSKF